MKTAGLTAIMGVPEANWIASTTYVWLSWDQHIDTYDPNQGYLWQLQVNIAHT